MAQRWASQQAHIASRASLGCHTLIISRACPHQEAKMLRPNRLRILCTAGALVSLLLTGCTTSHRARPKPTSPSSSPTPQVNATNSLTAPDGGKLVVAETGVSPIKDIYGKSMASFGIILTNTSRSWIADTSQVVIAFSDSSKRSITGPAGVSSYSPPGVLPGRKAGLGAQVYVGRGGVAHVKARIKSTFWIHIDTDTAEITANNVRIVRAADSEQHGTLTFTVNSAFKSTVRGRSVNAIFRSGSGRITGGAGGGEFSMCTAPPGRSTCREELTEAIPAGTVDSSTEIYLSGQ